MATTVQVGSTDVPKGIFARTISGGGNAAVARESIFSTGCVYDRSKIQTQGIDVAYGIPVGVHSSQTITESNGVGQYCPETNKPIHKTGVKNATDRPCNTNYPFDQDRLGESELPDRARDLLDLFFRMRPCIPLRRLQRRIAFGRPCRSATRHCQ